MNPLKNRFLTIAAALTGFACIGLTNQAATFSSDIENFIADKVLPLAQRQLIAYQFGDPLTLDAHRGTTYTASRYERLPLPYAALQQGVAPPGEAMSVAQISATAQQWGDRVVITDVANLTIKHPLFKKAVDLTAMQLPETLERNTFNTLVAATQVNYANGRANRAALVATDVLSPHEVNRLVGSLEDYGAPPFNGDEREDTMKDAGAYRKSKGASAMPHYVALIHPFPVQDMRENATVVAAWTHNDVNRLYNSELGEWGGVRFCKSNMVPYWIGVADPATNTASTAGGALATGTYYIQITGMPTQTSVERRIYQVSGAVTVTGPTGSISVVIPTLSNYVFNVYIGTTTSPTNLGLSASGPSVGSFAGQATQLASGATVVITGTGAAQTPPAAPATGIYVFPTIVIGKNAYGQVLLENKQFYYLKDADKSDPLNQTRVVGWKVFYGSIIENQNFLVRIESSSAFTPGYSTTA